MEYLVLLFLALVIACVIFPRLSMILHVGVGGLRALRRNASTQFKNQGINYHPRCLAGGAAGVDHLGIRDRTCAS